MGDVGRGSVNVDVAIAGLLDLSKEGCNEGTLPASNITNDGQNIALTKLDVDISQGRLLISLPIRTRMIKIDTS